MPGRDGTGPMGQGSMTGRGMGRCVNNETKPRFGSGFGRGMRLRGCGQRFAWNDDNGIDEITSLKEKIDGLQQQLDALSKTQKQEED